MDPRLEGACALPHLGVIRAAGEDAASFLHGQLTQDFALLGADQARLAAFCNAKGRMLASFVGLRHATDEIVLVLSADLLAQTLKRLSMFVLRAKVRLSDATADFSLYGLAGQAALDATPGTAAPWSRADKGNAATVRLYPALGQARALWVGPAGARPAGTELALGLWQWGEIQSGVAMLTEPLKEALVPQMLNYESVGGVNFKKGCYPGQEVVARSQFRGTLKRRAYVVHAPAEVQAGQELFHDSDPTQPCGLVVQSAPCPDGGWDAIASMQVSAAQSGRLTAVSAQGPALDVLPLPYPLLEDI